MNLQDDLVLLLQLGIAEQEVNGWAEMTFPMATQESRFAHLRREVDELGRDVYSGEEIADVFILLCGMARGVETPLAELVAAKLNVLRTRTWGEPDADGVGEHVR